MKLIVRLFNDSDTCTIEDIECRTGLSFSGLGPNRNQSLVIEKKPSAWLTHRYPKPVSALRVAAPMFSNPVNSQDQSTGLFDL
ncbi:MAG TPA: hypothetical protein DHW45_19375 [Candidatus Latescibacteria bacterium]|jgi:hypothetical protein|nr:hypothetical protein [Candidatus Latescibacterota bacterium]